MKILDNYITQLIENSTPQEPAWNIEKIRAGKPNTWNYIDGCMIKALLTIYDITEDARYLNFADEFIDYFVNEDGTEVSVGAVRCAAEDKDGNIWIGTSAGPLLLDPNQITASAPTFTQVKVPRNDGTNYADYLLSGIDVSCIAVDGANRKWFGTKKNGIYLISEDNLSEIHHFTTLNSPLLSNGIESIAINEKTGEVFIGTDKGLCSYMSDSSTPNESMTSDNVWAYPNPVKPDYTGLITIVGLSQNADVKILTSNGRIVNEIGRAHV